MKKLGERPFLVAPEKDNRDGSHNAPGHGRHLVEGGRSISSGLV